ncbi:MAG TPA: TlpA disulfide reductase family protein [Bryobacteraceae bacterium]|nr:TlpA disulfide reductase family protein [Bryobacteraceae bacterium]
MRKVAKLLLSPLVFGSLFAQGAPADILRSALKATEKIDTIEYEVRHESKGPDGKLHRSRSTILAARSPFRFQARFRDEDNQSRDMSVLEGDVTRYSADGVAGEIPHTIVAKGFIVPNQASTDAAMTWRPLLDREYMSAAIESGNIVYAGKDDVDGELCNTVLYVRVGDDSGSTVDWYWISVKTGLPRAVQRVNLRRGTTGLTARYIISILRINPWIPPDVFSYRPTPADSTPEAAPASSVRPPSLRGTRLPDLEVKDAAYASVKLSDMVGKPILITFWAPWCIHCIDELQALAELEPSYRGSLQVVAIAVQDSRLNILSWMKAHPQFDFTFVTDPELPETASRLVTYFNANGIPVSVLVGADGLVIENWGGFNSADELKQKLALFLRPSTK